MSDSAAELTQAAARLVVDEGLDYPAAKRKAARALGRDGARAALPSNEAVEDAVREHIALFHADTQPAELAELRRVALLWMQRLAEFRPHLAGAVWRGTATRLNDVLLDLYCDDPKAPEIALINHGIDYQSADHQDGQGRSVPLLRLDHRSAALGDWVGVRLALHDHDGLRGALRPDERGRTWRGDLPALQRLLAEEGRAPAIVAADPGRGA